MNTNEKGSLPEIFRPILWSYRFEDMDIKKHKQAIIIQAINYGTLEHWRWIDRTYGREEIRKVMQEISSTTLRAHVKKLAFLLFGLAGQQRT
ncbi:MAG: hypothetical protein A3E36_01580 [Candidatus Andersenbacteria bacterium RIFCSPHIGHO2_12_FULL_45_11b]|uniref:DUF6922 domain-containing protein n=1 Tax=Candidatus Andersenbacteria bacterium RIFCSPHIGHO2_12_FULL_45_11b TaxID=1797282 RepID=A0A1G1XE67_9BACT|nr:MAG: hypothetical protein A3E36_01580 [Candidatus Andersenbacteria bacterium RIFCSPHIGHO2_12_FULL_45_11b]